MSKRRVVVTGLGLVTPLGHSVQSTWDDVIAGRSGAGPITKFDVDGFPVRFACEVKGFVSFVFAEAVEADTIGAFTLYAIAASDEAMANSGLQVPDNAERIGSEGRQLLK